MKPRYFYKIAPNAFVAHSSTLKCLTIQQAHPINPERERDSLIFVDRADAAKLRDALDAWLGEKEDGEH